MQQKAQDQEEDVGADRCQLAYCWHAGRITAFVADLISTDFTQHVRQGSADFVTMVGLH